MGSPPCALQIHHSEGRGQCLVVRVCGCAGAGVRWCASAGVRGCATTGVCECRSVRVRGCASARVPEYPSARMREVREVRRAGLVCGNCWLKLAASASEGSSPARIRTEVLSIMSRLLWAAELRGRLLRGVVPHCFRWYLSVRSCQSHKHLQTRCAACFGRSLCSSSYPEIPCLWRLWGEVSGEVRRCQLRRVGCSVRWLAQARDDKASGFSRNPHPADRLCDYSLAVNLKEFS